MDDTCAQLAAIIADADDAIISRTLDGTITSWNHAAERLYGYPAAEMLGQTFDLALPNGESATQLVTSPDFGTRPIQFETTRRRADGSPVDVAIALSPIRDENGNVTGFASITRDISERKRLEAERQIAEAALRESEERFRSTFEWSPIGMALVGLDGRWLNVNPALRRIVGYTEDELQHLTFQDITHPDDLEVDLAQAQRLFAGEIPSYHLEKRYIRKDGTIVWVLLTGSLVHTAAGEALAVLAQIVDITDRKQADLESQRVFELQREANTELARVAREERDFLSVVNHEFRTPLTAILGYSELIAQGQLPAEEVASFAETIATSARRLGRMLDDLFVLDGLESRRAPVRRQYVDLSEVLAEVARTYQSTTPTHALALEIEPDLPPIVGERDRLIQVVTNLVSNAVKYSPPRSAITIAALPDGDTVRLQVRDQGIGIPPDALATIFDRYTRVRSGAARQVEGMGLGLAIVREIVEAHGGQVWAESEPGLGSTFHVRLPTNPSAPVRPSRLASTDGHSH